MGSEMCIRDRQGGGSTSANAGDKPVVNQALDSILGMAVQMPALKKLGDELGLSMENGIAAATSGAMDGKPEPKQLESVVDAEEDPSTPLN